MEKNELYLKTAFCCMACDGDIAKEEIDLIRSYQDGSSLFKGLDIEQKLNEYIELLKTQKIMFFQEFLKELSEFGMTKEEEANVAKVSVDMIEVDENVEYSEIVFFKKIRKILKSSNEELLAAIPESKLLPDKEIYILPDIIDDAEFEWNANINDLKINFTE